MTCRGLSDKALLTGVNFLAAYRSDYATGDRILFSKVLFTAIFTFILDANSILKAAYSYWLAKRKPIFETFEETLYQMVVSGDYAFSGKMLSSTPKDKDRTEHAWRTLLQPFKTLRPQVTAILYGSQKKELQKLTTSNSKYTLEDSKPSEED